MMKRLHGWQTSWCEITKSYELTYDNVTEHIILLSLYNMFSLQTRVNIN